MKRASTGWASAEHTRSGKDRLAAKSRLVTELSEAFVVKAGTEKGSAYPSKALRRRGEAYLEHVENLFG